MCLSKYMQLIKLFHFSVLLKVVDTKVKSVSHLAFCVFLPFHTIIVYNKKYTHVMMDCHHITSRSLFANFFLFKKSWLALLSCHLYNYIVYTYPHLIFSVILSLIKIVELNIICYLKSSMMWKVRIQNCSGQSVIFCFI